MKKMRRAPGPPHSFKGKERLLAVLLLVALLVLLLVLTLVLILVALILVILTVLHRSTSFRFTGYRRILAAQAENIRERKKKMC